MKKISILLASLLLAAAPCRSISESEARAAIEKGYAKAMTAADLKFVEGMLSLRAPGYMLVNPAGQRMDLSLERERFAELFRIATRVRLKIDIDKITPLEDGFLCKAHELLEIETVQLQTRSLASLNYDSVVEEFWKPTDYGWRIQWCRVLTNKPWTGKAFKVNPLSKRHF